MELLKHSMEVSKHTWLEDDLSRHEKVEAGGRLIRDWKS